MNLLQPLLPHRPKLLGLSLVLLLIGALEQSNALLIIGGGLLALFAILSVALKDSPVAGAPSIESEPEPEPPSGSQPDSTDNPESEKNLEEESAFEEEDEEPLFPVVDEENLWLTTAERADALFEICLIYHQLMEDELPLPLLIGPIEAVHLDALTGNALDRSLHIKEDLDAVATAFDVKQGTALLDQVLYCSLGNDREQRIALLLEQITPDVIRSRTIASREARHHCYQQIFHYLIEAGEFLSSEEEIVLEKWHQEFVLAPPPEPESEPDSSESTQVLDERITTALENLKKSRVETLPDGTDAPAKPPKKRKNPPQKKIQKARKLTERHGIDLDQLIHEEGQSKEEHEQQLKLILSARNEMIKEYSSHTQGTAADLLVESLLRVKLQNHVYTLYHQLNHGQPYETLKQQAVTQLTETFGPTVIKNHRKAIEHHLEWAANTDAPSHPEQDPGEIE